MSYELIEKQEFQGHIDGLPDVKYHGGPGISSTPFKEFLKSAAHFKSQMVTPRQDTPSFYDGRMFHSMMLEGKQPLCAPKFDRRTKEGKAAAEEWEANNKGALVYDWFDKAEANQSALDRLNGMVTALKKKKTVRNILSAGSPERSFYCKDTQTGLYLKARTDWITPDNIIVDIKTTDKSARLDAFEKTIFDYGYAISLAWYCRVISQAINKKVDTCILIAVEKKPPYESSVFMLKPELLDIGHQLISNSLPKLAECFQKDEWPGYSEDIQEVGVPTWALNKMTWMAAEVEA